MDHPNRKSPRIKDYDYSTPGTYFVTVCTKDKAPLLCTIVGEGLCALPQVNLTDIGKAVNASINYINTCTESATVDKYVIMPNHIHLIITLSETGGHRDPPLQAIIGQFKSYTTHLYGFRLWQRSFHDHVIRNDDDYNKIWEYIDTNPSRWCDDCFYSPTEVSL